MYENFLKFTAYEILNNIVYKNQLDFSVQLATLFIFEVLVNTQQTPRTKIEKYSQIWKCHGFLHGAGLTAGIVLVISVAYGRLDRLSPTPSSILSGLRFPYLVRYYSSSNQSIPRVRHGEDHVEGKTDLFIRAMANSIQTYPIESFFYITFSHVFYFILVSSIFLDFHHKSPAFATRVR